MKPFCSEWLSKKAAPEAPAAPAPSPASAPTPAKPDAPAPAAPGMQSLEEADKNRPAPPPNPTGAPAQKPMPMTELLKSLESASKSSIDAGVNLVKSIASLEKVQTIGGLTEKEMQIMSKSDEFSKKLLGIKEQLSAVSDALAKYRLSLSSGETKGWLNPK